MGIDKLGYRSFTSETKADYFVSALEQNKIMTTQCSNCGKLSFPPAVDCNNCLSSEAKWIDINSNGSLMAFSNVYYGPKGFENQTPYTIGIIRLANNLRIFGRISKKIHSNKIQVDMQLKVIPAKLPSGRITFEFVLPV